MRICCGLSKIDHDMVGDDWWFTKVRRIPDHYTSQEFHWDGRFGTDPTWQKQVPSNTAIFRENQVKIRRKTWENTSYINAGFGGNIIYKVWIKSVGFTLLWQLCLITGGVDDLQLRASGDLNVCFLFPSCRREWSLLVKSPHFEASYIQSPWAKLT
jgi:hypothetical protein